VADFWNRGPFTSALCFVVLSITSGLILWVGIISLCVGYLVHCVRLCIRRPVFKLLEMAVMWSSDILMVHYPNLGWMTTKIIFFKESAFGLAIIFFLIYEPNGLSYRYWQLKNYFNLWPFSYTGK
jgi:branched-chain amino acid transport system permease protein